MSKINKLVDDFSHKILKNVSLIFHNTTLLLSAFPHPVQLIYSSLWCHIVFPLSHFLLPTLTIKKQKNTPFNCPKWKKAAERAWIKCLFSSCFDKSSADTSLRATTCPLVCPCISDITGHPILSLNY